MKKIGFAFLTLSMAMLSVSVSAQNPGKFGADSAECIKYLSYYQEYFKQKNYDEALPNWRKAYKLCPATASQNLLINGSSLLQKEIAKTKDAQLRNAMIDSLLVLQDQRAETYPKYSVVAINNKAMYIAQYYKDPAVLYKEYAKVIEANKEQTKLNVLLLNLNAAIELFKAGKLEAEEVINTYQNTLDLISKAPAGDETTKAKTDVESLFITSQVASCENLISLFTPRFEAAPQDTTLVTNIVKMLGSTDGCQDNDLFLKAVTSMHNNRPSASSAYYLYKLQSSKDAIAEAVKYLEQAIAFEGLDTATKASYEFELATYCFKNGMNGKAFDYARHSAELDPSFQGKSYYLIGTI